MGSATRAPARGAEPISEITTGEPSSVSQPFHLNFKGDGPEAHSFKMMKRLNAHSSAVGPPEAPTP